jgi:hypothetical protein
MSPKRDWHLVYLRLSCFLSPFSVINGNVLTIYPQVVPQDPLVSLDEAKIYSTTGSRHPRKGKSR